MTFTLNELFILLGVVWLATIAVGVWFGYDWGQSDREWRQPPKWWARRRPESNPYPPPQTERKATLADLYRIASRDDAGLPPVPQGHETGPLARLYGGDYPPPPDTFPRPRTARHAS